MFGRFSRRRHSVENIVSGDGRVINLTGDRAQNLVQYFASDFNMRVRSGEQLNHEEKVYYNRFPRQFRCSNGHIVRSLSEKTIDDWFARRHIYHDYEYLIAVPEMLVPDFTVYTPEKKPVFIEYWRMMDDPDYLLRKKQKCEGYARYRLPLIELHKHDLRDLDESLTRKLRERGILFISNDAHRNAWRARACARGKAETL
jgi:hypothetical protein